MTLHFLGKAKKKECKKSYSIVVAYYKSKDRNRIVIVFTICISQPSCNNIQFNFFFHKNTKNKNTIQLFISLKVFSYIKYRKLQLVFIFLYIWELSILANKIKNMSTFFKI